MRINLTDNNSACICNRNDVATLFPIANKTIEKLCGENENLLVFPHSISISNDKIGESPILTLSNTDDPEKVCINTGNIMGFVGVNGLQVKIKSRFDEGRDDYLLHYMLQKVLSFNLFNLNHNNEQEDIFDFIMFVFPFLLKSALRQEIYREYQNYKHNDSNIRGTIDVAKHIGQNIPFRGNFAYSTREYSCDNNMTELIRHTIEFMKTKKYGQSVLTIDQETIENVGLIIDHTPLYNRNERERIISKNLRMKAHPYYTEYRPLQSLCLQILRMDGIKYGEADDEICGILFDGAWLWEEYVNSLLYPKGFIHPENKHGKGKIYLFEGNSGVRYPDFYKGDYVLDAKYKRLGSYDRVSKVERDDVHQIITYMTNLHATKGGFIVPLEKKQERIPTARLKESASTLSILGVEISKASSSYTDFCNEMKVLEKEFLNSLLL